jgi:hypothetical protein
VRRCSFCVTANDVLMSLFVTQNLEASVPNCRSALSRRAPPRTEPPDPMFGVVQPAFEDGERRNIRAR